MVDFMGLEAYEDARREILQNVEKSLSGVDPSQVERMLEEMIAATGRRILVLGAGRSGLVGKAFAMRLMHLGFDVYVMGETITPSIGKGDLILALSGSGSTKLVVIAAQIGKEVGAKVIAVTSHPKSELAKLADHVVILRGRTKLAEESDYFLRQLMGEHEPLAPLGTVFEMSLMVFLDSLIVELMRRLGKTAQDMRKQHATIE
jgi:6-phospho-3-hexuloisomerase